MMLRTGRQQQQNSRSGVTLLELILVMAILATVMAVAVPQLKGFSVGRRYDAEWNRFIAALRYARNQAISRSVPVEIRFDTQRNAYSLAGGYGFDHLPDGTTEHVLADGLTFDIPVEPKTTNMTTFPKPNTGLNTMMTTVASATTTAPAVASGAGSGTALGTDTPTIVFWPDGTVDDTSPAEIWITESKGPFAKVVQKSAVLGYTVPAEGVENALPAK